MILMRSRLALALDIALESAPLLFCTVRYCCVVLVALLLVLSKVSVLIRCSDHNLSCFHYFVSFFFLCQCTDI